MKKLFLVVVLIAMHIDVCATIIEKKEPKVRSRANYTREIADLSTKLAALENEANEVRRSLHRSAWEYALPQIEQEIKEVKRQIEELEKK